MSADWLWEWVVDCGNECAPTGISGARHRAMAALSQSLAKSGDHAAGHVVPVMLVDGPFGCSYHRLANHEMKADCKEGIIRWH